MTWIFGYGSLVWRPAFPFVERVPGHITGYVRRFYQGSTDHRGVPGAPGRVVTLLPAPDDVVTGVAYRVDPAHEDAVLAKLDHREKGGYERRVVEMLRADGDPIDVLLYVATEDNDNYLGPASIDVIAEQVRGSVGPSGPNVEYVLELARALRALGFDDPHVFELAAAVESGR